MESLFCFVDRVDYFWFTYKIFVILKKLGVCVESFYRFVIRYTEGMLPSMKGKPVSVGTGFYIVKRIETHQAS